MKQSIEVRLKFYSQEGILAIFGVLLCVEEFIWGFLVPGVAVTSGVALFWGIFSETGESFGLSAYWLHVLFLLCVLAERDSPHPFGWFLSQASLLAPAG